MIILRILCLLSFIILNSCSTFLTPSSKRANDANEQRKSSGFLDSFFPDDYNDEQNTNQNKENNRPSLAQGTISSQNKRNNYTNYTPGLSALNPNMFSLIHIDGNTWRTSAHPAMVFGIMSRILSQNYIIHAMDRKNMNLQTDWDKFFIDGRLFRNRINIMVFPVNPKQTEVVLKNIVEYYTGSSNNKIEENSAWLPSPDITDEINKLIDNTNRQTAIAQSQMIMRSN
ncbi:hypothetical protein [Silvanigrella aquatica]|uniref:Lipoprotein n=1 Tax=Silvanigrella aquatica TaxID=1915309 RepID=A0A1L4D021_9BACT|nr:hypothetical protein [Silvanigrella aquatica]APJ03551.1 hypothetical protein AXG55_06375 [Silvanigrella aquatica]